MKETRWIYIATCKCGKYLGEVGSPTPFTASLWLEGSLCQSCGNHLKGFHPDFTVKKIKQIRNPKARWWNAKPEWITKFSTDA